MEDRAGTSRGGGVFSGQPSGPGDPSLAALGRDLHSSLDPAPGAGGSAGLLPSRSFLWRSEGHAGPHSSACSQGWTEALAVLPTLPSSLPAWQALGRGPLSPWKPQPPARTAGRQVSADDLRLPGKMPGAPTRWPPAAWGGGRLANLCSPGRDALPSPSQRALRGGVRQVDAHQGPGPSLTQQSSGRFLGSSGWVLCVPPCSRSCRRHGTRASTVQGLRMGSRLCRFDGTGWTRHLHRPSLCWLLRRPWWTHGVSGAASCCVVGHCGKTSLHRTFLREVFLGQKFQNISEICA